jgi:hypothetical protein
VGTNELPTIGQLMLMSFRPTKYEERQLDKIRADAASRAHVPMERFQYLDDPDYINELAEIWERRYTRWQKRRNTFLFDLWVGTSLFPGPIGIALTHDLAGITFSLFWAFGLGLLMLVALD